jgi:hypothetical protein
MHGRFPFVMIHLALACEIFLSRRNPPESQAVANGRKYVVKCGGPGFVLYYINEQEALWGVSLTASFSAFKCNQEKSNGK